MLGVATALVALAGCGGSGGGGGGSTLHLGYFANVTHAVPIVGLREGIFRRALPGTTIDASILPAGPEAIQSLLAGSMDVAYLGPGPLIGAASRAPGKLAIAAGANDGGASLIARSGAGISGPRDLAGHTVAVPGTGNTQDLSLRIVLARVGLPPVGHAGSAKTAVVKNADLATALDQKVVDAAMAPEPWGSQLVAQTKAVVVLGDNQVLDGGRYPTTVLVARTSWAKDHPDLLRRLVAANARAVRMVADHPGIAARDFSALLEETGGKPIPAGLLRQALANQHPTTAVARAPLAQFIDAADKAGYLDRRPSVDELLNLKGKGVRTTR